MLDIVREDRGWELFPHEADIGVHGYKRVEHVVEVAEKVGLARRVARPKPPICIKGRPR